MHKSVSRLETLITKKTNSIYDFEFVQALRALPWGKWLEKDRVFYCREQYLEKIHSWIHSSRQNLWTGLENFSQRHLVAGTTQCFDEAYFRYSKRRLRFFRGEYAYHRRVFANWKFLEDDELNINDWIIISSPFCSTGNIHPRTFKILDRAEQLQVPALIDCAYFGTCEGLQFDANHPAIAEICFSLTKGLGMGDFRSGIRYSNYSDNYPIADQNKRNHTVLCNARVGLYMMEQFSPDHIPLKYSSAQKVCCQLAKIKPTPCMHLATADGLQWQDYKIDNAICRIGIAQLVKSFRNGDYPVIQSDSEETVVLR